MEYTINPLVGIYKLDNELVITKSPFSESYVSLSISDEREYSQIVEFLKFLEKPREPDEMLVKSREIGIPDEIVDTLIEYNVIIPTSIPVLHHVFCIKNEISVRKKIRTVYYIYSGELGEYLLSKFKKYCNLVGDFLPLKSEELDLNNLKADNSESLIVVVTDPRDFELLRRVNEYVISIGRANTDLKFLPIYTLGMSVIIGPLVTPFSSCYICSDTQIRLAQQNSYLWESLSRPDVEILNFNPPYETSVASVYYDFVSSFIMLLVGPILEGNLCHVLNKVTIVDLERIFIDSFHVYKMPLCECSKFRKSLEV